MTKLIAGTTVAKSCPKCYYDTKLIIKEGRKWPFFLGCPNCAYKCDLPESMKMILDNQPRLL